MVARNRAHCNSSLHRAIELDIFRDGNSEVKCNDIIQVMAPDTARSAHQSICK